MNETKARAAKFLVSIFIPILLMTALGRIISVIYANISTDVMYDNSRLPIFLYYTKRILAVLTRGFGFSSIIFGHMNISKKAGNTAVALVILVEFLDCAASFSIDMFQSNILGREFSAIVYLLVNFLFGVLILVTIAVISILVMKKSRGNGYEDSSVSSLISLKKPPQRAILFSSLMILTVKIISEAIYTVQFLFDVNFILYEGEFLSIISAYISILLTDGVLTYVTIMISYVLLSSMKTNKNL